MMTSRPSNSHVVKAWNVQAGEVKAMRNNDSRSVYFTLTNHNDETTLISEECISGIPKEAKQDLTKMSAYLNETYVRVSKLSDGQNQLHVNMRLLGGANIIDPRTDSNKLWPKGIIPYDIDSHKFKIGTVGREEVLKAIEIWNDANTGFKLVPRTNQNDYLVFGEDPHSCYSYVGYQGGAQYIRCNLEGGLFNAGNLAHEIGHAIGFHHEHQRIDRDEFIKVDEASTEYSSANYEPSGIPYGNYDFNSLFHYPRSSAWSPKRGLAKEAAKAGQRTQLSPGDIAAAKYLYKYAAKMGSNDLVKPFPIQGNDINVYYDNPIEKPQWLKMLDTAKIFIKNSKFEEARSYLRAILREYHGYLASDMLVFLRHNMNYCDFSILLNKADKNFEENNFKLSYEFYSKIINNFQDKLTDIGLKNIQHKLEQSEECSNLLKSGDSFFEANDFEYACHYFSRILNEYGYILNKTTKTSLNKKIMQCNKNM